MPGATELHGALNREKPRAHTAPWRMDMLPTRAGTWHPGTAHPWETLPGGSAAAPASVPSAGKGPVLGHSPKATCPSGFLLLALCFSGCPRAELAARCLHHTPSVPCSCVPLGNSTQRSCSHQLDGHHRCPQSSGADFSQNKPYPEPLHCPRTGGLVQDAQGTAEWAPGQSIWPLPGDTLSSECN